MLDRRNKKSLASRLRHRVEVQVPSSVSDGEGGYQSTWGTTAIVWASVDPVREKQSTDYRSINVDATHIICVRGDVNILDTYQFWFDNRAFEILAQADYQERGIIKVIHCKEVKRL